MRQHDRHLDSEEILLAADEELPAQRQIHLDACRHCRARLEGLRSGEAIFQEVLLQANFATWPVGQARPPVAASQIAALLLGVIGIAALGFFLQSSAAKQDEARNTPKPHLTPGASQGIARAQACIDSETQAPIPLQEALAVFASYGIHQPTPGSYEVDFLIPPALGGTLTRQNLWPQPYREGVWNSRVKDALEDHLAALVCAGRLDLSTAQHDIAKNWVGSYKRYFGVSQPLPDHFAFVKDPAWE